MLKKILFLSLLLVSAQANAAANDPVSITSIQGLIEQGKINEAIKQLRLMVKKEPKNYQSWFLLGVNQAEKRQYDDAIESFNHVVELQPKLAEPHNNLAVIYNETGNYQAAVNELEISLTLKPDYMTAQENVGDLYIKLAADAYRKVLVKKNDPLLQQRYQRLLAIRDVAPAAATEEKVSKEKKPGATSAKMVAVTAAPDPVVKKTVRSEPAVKKFPVVMKATHLQQSKQAVLSALEAWRQAWGRKDMPAYFAAYSDEYQYGEKYVSFAKWKDYKTWAMRKREFIKVNIENVVTTVLAKNVIKVQFLQHFRSDSFNNDNRKEMLFRKSDDGWKIIYEASM